MTELLLLDAEPEPGVFHVVVESPRGSRAKIKYEPKLGTFKVSRMLSLGLVYPFDWGFVPGTKGPDGDPLDALVLWDLPTYPGLIIPCRPLAVIEVSQRENRSKPERNDRIVFTPAVLNAEKSLVQFEELSRDQRLEVEQFFVGTTFFTSKEMQVLGWQGPDKAADLIRRSRLSR